MASYIIRRLLLVLPILFIVAVLAFAVTNIVPGDPVRLMLGDFATEAQVAEMRSALGLDQPIHVRFVRWLSRVVRGDLGQSLFVNASVVGAIRSRLEPTVLIALGGQLIAILVGIPLGVLAAVHHKRIPDQISIFVSLLGVSVPSFWLAITLMTLFGVQLGWLPVAGYRAVSEVGAGVVRYIALPSLSIGLMQSGLLARMTRSAMLDVLHQNYIRTAKAKGLGPVPVVWRHGLRNAAIPIITVIGASFSTLLGGTWIIEAIYNIPGTGALAVTAILRRDYPVIQGSIIFAAFVYVIINLLVDLSYVFLNPQVRLEDGR